MLLLNHYINAFYIPEIFLTTDKLDLDKIFDWQLFHIIVIGIAKIFIYIYIYMYVYIYIYIYIRGFLKFEEIIVCDISMFSISWIATIVIFLSSLFLKAHLKPPS